MTNAQRADVERSASVAVRSPSDPATQLTDELARLRHDLRNALLPLLLHFDLLDLHARGAAPPTAASPADLAAHIQRLSNGLLLRTAEQAAGSGAGPLSLSQWWQEIGDLVGAPLRPPRALDAQFSDRLPTVITHPVILAHVVLHMLVTARLAQPSGVEPVSLTARRAPHGVTLTIRNAEDGVRLARMRRADAGAARWGMTLARSLLVASGGDISGSSHADTGTHVVIRLPTTDAASPASQTGAALGEATHPQTAHHNRHPTPTARPAFGTVQRPTRVLIIDDNAALTGALGLRFAMDGGFTSVAPLHVLSDSLRHIDEQQPDIVLLDLNLPGEEHPLDLIRTLQTRGSPVRVVVLTGNPSRSAVNATRLAGGAGFIAKGVSPDRLLAALRRVGDEPFVLELDT